MAWRNLWRHPRRTLLTALALSLGLALLLVALGLGDGAHKQMVDHGVRLGSGHVVVQARGCRETRSQDLLLSAQVIAAVRELLSAWPVGGMVQGVSPRLFSSGLLSSATSASGVGILGVLPRVERAISLVPRRMVEGSYWEDGSSSGIVLGSELARKLEVRLGSKVVLMAQGVVGGEEGGEIRTALFRVRGIFHTGLREVDAYRVLLPLSRLQELLGAGDRVTQVAIFLSQEEASPFVAEYLRAGLQGKGVEVWTWKESMAELAQFVWLDDAFNYVLNGVVLAMVGLGLFNTILMSVFERRYEMGVCAALGLRPLQLAGVVLWESFFLVLMSLALGLALGLGAHCYFATFGLDLRSLTERPLSTAGTVFDPILYSYLSPERTAEALGALFLMAMAFSLYPAFKAARTELPDTLRVF